MDLYLNFFFRDFHMAIFIKWYFRLLFIIQKIVGFFLRLQIVHQIVSKAICSINSCLAREEYCVIIFAPLRRVYSDSVQCYNVSLSQAFLCTCKTKYKQLVTVCMYSILILYFQLAVGMYLSSFLVVVGT